MLEYEADPYLLEDLVEFAIEGNNLDALTFAYENDFEISLWEWNEYSESYLLQYAVFMHVGPDGEWVYSKDQDEFVIYLLNIYVSDARERENTEELWDPVYDANTFYNLVDLSVEFENIEVLDWYFQLVAEVQEVEDAILIFPKKYYNYAVKAWGDLEIGSIVENYKINKDY